MFWINENFLREFFLIGTHNSQDSREKEKAIFFNFFAFEPLTSIQTFSFIKMSIAYFHSG